MDRENQHVVDPDDGARAPGAAITLEVSQVHELPRPQAPFVADPPRMYAVITVTVRKNARAAAPARQADPDPVEPPGGAERPPLAEVLLIDHSSSMVIPPSRLAAAREAAVGALARLPDGAQFALVAGRKDSDMIYPRRPALAVADAVTRAEAEAALHGCTPGGGTAMGTWLERARRLFQGAEGDTAGPGTARARHALLLTDGKNLPAYESREELTARVERCAGRFTCDAVGIGDDWETEELLLITGRLGGRARAVADLAQLPAELAALAQRAAERDLTGLRLRLYHRKGVRLHYFEQVHPTRTRLRPAHVDRSDEESGRGGPVEEYDTAPWGDETRDYLLCVSAPYEKEQRDKELLLTEVEVDVDPPSPAVQLPLGKAVLMRWSDEADLYSRLDPRVAHYQHEEELHDTYERACAELKSGRREEARTLLATAWKLAATTGDTTMQDHLRKLVRVVDPDRGEVELLDRIARFDVEAARIHASTTVLPGGAER
ncbi:VWA domain-containing protein [Actinomycetota bacterium Odt1-20B]